MATGSCPNCSEPLETGYSVCWRCGTHSDGSPPSTDFVPDTAPPLPDAAPRRVLACLRCQAEMRVVGRLKLHEGSRALPFILGNVGELFVNRETFDTYACSRCGKVELYVASEP